MRIQCDDGHTALSLVLVDFSVQETIYLHVKQPFDGLFKTALLSA